MEAVACAYCGDEVVGKRRDARYCSDRCRRQTWDEKPQQRERCVDCGKLLWPGSAHKTNRPAQRCRPCLKLMWDEQNADMAAMWNDGSSAQEIAVAIGWTPGAVYTHLYRMRNEYGYDIRPHYRRVV